MENKSITIVLSLVLVVAIGFFIYNKKQADVNPAPASGTVEEGTGGVTGPADEPLTLAVVATHNSRTSCWTAISGSVYDLTGWIPNHPGGEAAILGLCGKDGTAAFAGKHGGDARPKTVLAGFKIGVLTQ